MIPALYGLFSLVLLVIPVGYKMCGDRGKEKEIVYIHYDEYDHNNSDVELLHEYCESKGIPHYHKYDEQTNKMLVVIGTDDKDHNDKSHSISHKFNPTKEYLHDIVNDHYEKRKHHNHEHRKSRIVG